MNSPLTFFKKEVKMEMMPAFFGKHRWLLVLGGSLLFFVLLGVGLFYWFFSYQVELGKVVEVGNFHLVANQKVEEDDWAGSPRILKEQQAGRNYLYIAHATVGSFDPSKKEIGLFVGEEANVKGSLRPNAAFSTFVTSKNLLNNRMLVVLRKEEKIDDLKTGETVLAAFQSNAKLGGEINEDQPPSIQVLGITRKFSLL